MTILTDEERKKFAAYLRENAASNEQLIEQMKELNLPCVVADAMIKQRRIEIMAEKVIAQMLERTESWTLDKDGS